MLFGSIQKIYLKKPYYFSKIYYRTPYLDHLLHGANVAPTSQIRPCTMLFLPTVEKSKLRPLRGIQCCNIHIKFTEYWPIELRSWKQTHTQHHNLIKGLGAFAASELDKVFSGYQPR
jgi:hypothetical protein